MFAGFKALSSWHFAKRRHGRFSIGFKGAAVVTAVLVAAPLPITGLVVHSPTVISKETNTVDVTEISKEKVE